MGPYLKAAVRATGGAEAVGERAPSMLWSLGGCSWRGVCSWSRGRAMQLQILSAVSQEWCFRGRGVAPCA